MNFFFSQFELTSNFFTILPTQNCEEIVTQNCEEKKGQRKIILSDLWSNNKILQEKLKITQKISL
jgi:hypothetical protein